MSEERAIDNLGPHLLGRKYEPDERDYKLADYLDESKNETLTTDLDQALKNLKASKNVAVATKNWATVITNYLKALPAPSPSPSPTPDPTPTPTPTPSGDVTFTNTEPVLDQGQYGTCVGNGWAQWGNTQPVDDSFNEKDARAIYYEATCIDGECDSTYQAGSTVRSGAKAMQNRGRLNAYAFASGISDIQAFMRQSNGGPVVVGSDWLNDMFNPDANGYIKPTGAVEGGHCYLLIGDLPSESAFLFLNSWGTSWGLNGYFKMKYTDFESLLSQQGEACAAVELPKA